jgi:HK97 family phage major capsid protein
MYSDDHIRRLHEERANIHTHMKDIADRDQRGDLSAEDEAAWQKANADFERLTAAIRRAEEGNGHQEIAERHAEARAVQRPQFLTDAPTAPADNSDEAILRRLISGEMRSHEFMPERRDVLKSSTGSPVPTSFYGQLIEHLVVMTPMLDPNVVTVLTTNSGENLQIPRTSAYSFGSATAEAGTILDNDPTFQAFLTLGSYKYAILSQLSSEVITDSGVDLTGFLARQMATGMATAVGARLTVGTGTVEPTGIVPSAAAGITGGTGLSGAATADNLIDLSFAVNSSWRRSTKAGWMCSSTQLAAIRKLKTTDGYYIYEPNIRGFQGPDTLLGFPIYENPDVVVPAVNAKSIIFGDLGSFFVRQVGGINIARSDEFAFGSDLITFRATWRGDSGLPQTAAIKVFAGGTA